MGSRRGYSLSSCVTHEEQLPRSSAGGPGNRGLIAPNSPRAGLMSVVLAPCSSGKHVELCSISVVFYEAFLCSNSKALGTPHVGEP